MARECHTAWPRDRGLMSRNAKTLSDSNSLKEGISPIRRVRWLGAIGKDAED